MKKVLFSVAILAAFASCSKNEVTDVPQTNEITFSTLNDRVTKGANNPGDTSDDYMVYAVTPADGATGWFISEKVYGATDADAATTADAIASGVKYYYPAAATSTNLVKFYAYAPATATTVTDTYDALSIEYTVNGDADEDFTTAQATAYEGEVALSFAHQLAKVDITAALHTDLSNYTLTTGTATLVATGGDTFTVDLTTGTVTAATSGDAATYSGATSYMIAPQSAIDCTVQLNDITIVSKTDGSYLVGSASAGADMTAHTIVATEVDAAGVGTADTFVAGKVYTLTLTIDSSSTTTGGDIFNGEITFASTIGDWTPATGTITQE